MIRFMGSFNTYHAWKSIHKKIDSIRHAINFIIQFFLLAEIFFITTLAMKSIARIAATYIAPR